MNLFEYLESETKLQGKRVVVVFGGRFQPPTIAHNSVISRFLNKSGIKFYVLTGTKVDTKNPLSFEERKKLLNTLFPSLKVKKLVGSMYNVDDVLKSIGESKDVILINLFSAKDLNDSYKSSTVVSDKSFYRYFSPLKSIKNMEESWKFVKLGDMKSVENGQAYMYILKSKDLGNTPISATSIRNLLETIDNSKTLNSIKSILKTVKALPKDDNYISELANIVKEGSFSGKK